MANDDRLGVLDFETAASYDHLIEIDGKHAAGAFLSLALEGIVWEAKL